MARTSAAAAAVHADAEPAWPTPPLVADWLQYLAKERQMSAHTITAYTSDLARFTTFLGARAQGAAWDWGTVDRNLIRSFLGYLSRQGLERRSIARTLSAVRGFYRYLHRDEHVTANPARSVRTPKVGRHLPAHLDSGTMQTLMDAASTRAQGGAYADVRNLAMLELFYATGMRLSELHGLDRGDIDLVSLRVKVRGKGRKERIIPFGGPARLANINYESRREELMRHTGPKADRAAWFLNPRGRRLSRRDS
jgi:integrase/recombinase XerC